MVHLFLPVHRQLRIREHCPSGEQKGTHWWLWLLDVIVMVCFGGTRLGLNWDRDRVFWRRRRGWDIHRDRLPVAHGTRAGLHSAPRKQIKCGREIKVAAGATTGPLSLRRKRRRRVLDQSQRREQCRVVAVIVHGHHKDVARPAEARWTAQRRHEPKPEGSRIAD